ncbi:MAG: HAMP domain-containing histidine kinase, partial [Gemmatimonadaceae bacterium]|nr:HAMP domain-containing histidine kinase [Gloeobacterales cyanobacterium ES-bin-141]
MQSSKLRRPVAPEQWLRKLALPAFFARPGEQPAAAEHRSEATSATPSRAWVQAYSPYLIAVLSVTIALLLAIWIAPALGLFPLMLLFTAVVVSALYGGMKAGFLAIALTLAGSAFFPLFSLASEADRLRLLLFLFTATLVVLLNSLVHSRSENQAQIAELQKLDRLKDDFLSTVSHELRTPIANMTMAIHMLKRPIPAEKREQYLRILEKECAREADLLNDSLDLQRIEASSRPLRLEAILLQEWLPRVVEPYFLQAQQRSQQLVLKVSPDLAPLTTDSISLERIVSELIHNACKYTPAGGVLTIQATLNGERGLQLSVSNTGIEIPPQELLYIFDRFYRIPNNDPWDQGGTGLGLALVKKLVEYLGGIIAVESAANRTVFTIELPTVL